MEVWVRQFIYFTPQPGDFFFFFTHQVGDFFNFFLENFHAHARISNGAPLSVIAFVHRLICVCSPSTFYKARAKF